MDTNMAELPQLTYQELAAKIAELLVNGPLYRKFVYDGTKANLISDRGVGNRFGGAPNQIRTQ